MATSPPRSSTPPTVPDDDETAEETGLQLPLSASLVLTSLPKDAATALREADENDGVPAKGEELYFFRAGCSIYLLCGL